MKRVVLASLALLMGLPCLVFAQEAAYMPAATQPGMGRLVVRERVFGYALEGDRDLLHSHTDITYGLTPDLSVNLHVPVVFEFDEVGDDDQGISDLHIMGKYRFLLVNPGPVDTLRASVLFGIDIPTYDDDMSTDAFNPMLGVVATRIAGRHGTNAAVRYKLNYDGQPDPDLPGMGLADTLWTEGSYLYRLTPERYSAETTSSTYAVIEASLVYETNGDAHLWLAPGFLYEAQTWALGASVTLPAWQDLDERPDLEVGFAIDLRFLF
ncbi:hypothetical protein [Mucisphaera sp.]|uniref:hypothetical protein n=1 Tax=Mucisphaera sp. TaxID=2913024 RepID=UPI003D13B064